MHKSVPQFQQVPIVSVEVNVPQGVDINQLYLLTNKDRTNNGIASLAHNPLLDQSAQEKCKDMVDNNYFEHNSPSGKTPWDVIKKYISGWKKLGENLAANFQSATITNNAFMNSAEHKDNILDPKFTDVGFAYCEISVLSFRTYTVEHFAQL